MEVYQRPFGVYRGRATRCTRLARYTVGAPDGALRATLPPNNIEKKKRFTDI
jgi:hypothetical protein